MKKKPTVTGFQRYLFSSRVSWTHS